MKKTLLIILILLTLTFNWLIIDGYIYAKGNRQDDPSYQVDHNRTRNFSPTQHFTQDQIERVSDIFSGMTGNTFTINSDLQNVTSKLIFGRTTGGNGEFSYLGSLGGYTLIGIRDIRKGLRVFAETGGLRIYPYYDATYGMTIEAVNLAESGFVPFTLSGNKFIFNSGSVLINTTSAIGSEKLRVNGDIYGDGTASLDALILREKSADPANPAEGQSVIWQSDGTGAGDDGDIMVKITAGGVTKTTTLVDFSGI